MIQLLNFYAGKKTLEEMVESIGSVEITDNKDLTKLGQRAQTDYTKFDSVEDVPENETALEIQSCTVDTWLPLLNSLMYNVDTALDYCTGTFSDK